MEKILNLNNVKGIMWIGILQNFVLYTLGVYKGNLNNYFFYSVKLG